MKVEVQVSALVVGIERCRSSASMPTHTELGNLSVRRLAKSLGARDVTGYARGDTGTQAAIVMVLWYM